MTVVAALLELDGWELEIRIRISLLVMDFVIKTQRLYSLDWAKLWPGRRRCPAWNRWGGWTPRRRRGPGETGGGRRSGSGGGWRAAGRPPRCSAPPTPRSSGTQTAPGLSAHTKISTFMVSHNLEHLTANIVRYLVKFRFFCGVKSFADFYLFSLTILFCLL